MIKLVPAIIAAALLCWAWPYCADAQTTAPAQTDGRFVIVHSPHTERDVILLDTRTGKTWALTTYTNLNGDPYVWEPIPQINTDADTDAAVAKYGRKPVAASPAPQ